MLIYPDKYLKNVKEITIDFLEENNIKALILDVDNTLIDFDKNLLARSKKVVRRIKKTQYKILHFIKYR